MYKSHFLVKIEGFIKKGLEGSEKILDQIKPIRTLTLFSKSSDHLYNKFERLPPQSHFSQEIAFKIFEGLGDGLDESAACARARIPQDIVQKWLILGRKGLSPFQEFALEFEGYIADHEHGMLTAFAQADPVAYAQFQAKNSRTLQQKYNRASQPIMVVNAGPIMPSLTKEQSRAKMAELANQGITMHPSREQ